MRNLSRETILGLALIALLVLAALAIPGCVQKWRSERAQARTDASQAQAASDSARDAINAVAASGARETASEGMTRDNEAAIRAAPGGDARVDMGVHSVGLAALCKRVAYQNEPRCKPFRKDGR